MKLLVIGSPTSKGYKSLGYDISISGGGWVENLLDCISNNKNLEIFSLFYTRLCKEIKFKKIDNITYIALPEKGKNIIKCNKKMIDDLKKVVNLTKPDLVHIIGTEREYNYRLAEIVGFNKVIASITGLVSIIEKHYYGGIEEKHFNVLSFADIIRKAGPKNERKNFQKNAFFEKKLLSSINYVMGRTTWDYACVKQINPNINYYYCGEIINPLFSKYKWKLDKCISHRIFISQGSYPLKGLHKFLEAFPIILKEFPDSEVYIGGPNILKSNKLIDRIKRTTYAKYILKIIKKNKINMSKINFTGPLTPSQMLEQYLKCNVYVLPSCIENSPNSLGEAMKLGVPSVAACVGGVQDMIKDKIDGYIYPFDESYMLAYYVCQIFKNNDIVEKISKNAIESSSKRFNPEEVKNRTIDIYDYAYDHLHKE